MGHNSVMPLHTILAVNENCRARCINPCAGVAALIDAVHLHDDARRLRITQEDKTSLTLQTDLVLSIDFLRGVTGEIVVNDIDSDDDSRIG